MARKRTELNISVELQSTENSRENARVTAPLVLFVSSLVKSCLAHTASQALPPPQQVAEVRSHCSSCGQRVANFGVTRRIF